MTKLYSGAVVEQVFSCNQVRGMTPLNITVTKYLHFEKSG